MLTLATLSLVPLTAHADDVSTTGKGVVGGTLLGAEIVLATEAAFKVQPTWAYVVGGLGGAAAGGLGGYAVEQSASSRTTLLLLAGGMAFAIPTTVAVLSATAYEPPASYTQDRAPADEPVAEPPQPSATPTPVAPGAPASTSPTGTEVTAPPATTPPTSSVRKAQDARTSHLAARLPPQPTCTHRRLGAGVDGRCAGVRIARRVQQE